MAASNPIIRVFPDAHQVERALTDAAKAGAGFVDASGYLSWGQLVELFEPNRVLNRRRCSPLTSRIVLWALAQDIPNNPFQEFVREPAFARSALEVLLRLKAGCLTPPEFARAVGQLPPQRQARGHFLAALFDAYQRRLSELKLADREDLVAAAVRRLQEQGLPPLLAGAQAVEIHALYDFSPLRFQFLDALASQCHRHRVELRWLVPASGSPAVDAVLDSVRRKIEARWGDLNVEVHPAHWAGERPLASLGERMFDGSDRAPVEATGLELLSVGTARDEARYLAHRVRRWVEEGVAPEQIAVAYRDLGEEAEVVAEALEDLGIPARVRLGAPLASTTVGRLALELPLLVDDQFPASGVSRYLESRYLPALGGAGAEPVGAVLSLASIRDDQMGASAEEGAYAIRLRSLAQREAAGRSDWARWATAVATRVERLMSIGRQLVAEAPVEKQLSSWWGALEQLGLPGAVRRPEPRRDEGSCLGREVMRALARDQAAAEALRELVVELDSALRLAGAGGRRMERRVFQRWLLDASVDFNLMPSGPRGGAVCVVDARELVGTCFRRVWLAGVVEGRFPGRAPPNPLFPDEDRAVINSAVGREVFQLMVGDLERRLPFRPAEDRLVLFHSLAAATDGACVSYARQGLGGNEQLASPFFDELKRLTNLSLTSVKSSSVPRLDEVDSLVELQERVALEVLSWPELRSTEPDPRRAALEQAFAQEPWFRLAQLLSAIESERIRFFSSPEAEPSRYSGLIEEPELGDALQERFQFDAKRPLSASTMNRFGNCAFQGFLSFALGLEEPDSPGEELDGRRRGSFWHKVLEILMPRLKAAGLLGVAPEEIPSALLDEVLEEAATEFQKRDHVGHPVLWRLGRDRARSMVRRVLGASTHGLPFEGQLPEDVERRFGDARSEEPWRDIVVPAAMPGEVPVHVLGKIDRLDSAPNRMGVVDYKSRALGSLPKQWEAMLVTEFQLPLYLFAARASGHAGALEAAWLSLKDGKSVGVDQVLAEAGQTLEALLSTERAERERLAAEGQKNFANAVHQMVSELKKGRFPARPQDCRFCAYRSVCRISERQLSESSDG